MPWDLALLWLWCRPAAAAAIPRRLGTSICCRCVGEKKKKRTTVGFVTSVEKNVNNNSRKVRRGDIKINHCMVLICELYHLKVNRAKFTF